MEACLIKDYIMKTMRLITILLASLLLLTGCDFFRKITGKPTSKELEQMKIEAQAAERRAIEERNRAIADSLNLVKARQEAEALKAKALDKKYYVIIGSFKVAENADRLYATLEKKGYTPKEIRFNNGYDVVAAGGYDTFKEAFIALEDLLTHEYAPDDSYIYDTSLGYHQ